MKFNFSQPSLVFVLVMNGSMAYMSSNKSNKSFTYLIDFVSAFSATRYHITISTDFLLSSMTNHLPISEYTECFNLI